jgi:hypothetical protein
MKVKGLNLNLGASCSLASCRSCLPAPDPPAPLLPAHILPPPDRRPLLWATVLARATIDVSCRHLLGSSTPGHHAARSATAPACDEPTPGLIVHCPGQAGAHRRPPHRSSRELSVSCPGPSPCPMRAAPTVA